MLMLMGKHNRVIKGSSRTERIHLHSTAYQLQTYVVREYVEYMCDGGGGGCGQPDTQTNEVCKEVWMEPYANIKASWSYVPFCLSTDRAQQMFTH